MLACLPLLPQLIFPQQQQSPINNLSPCTAGWCWSAVCSWSLPPPIPPTPPPSPPPLAALSHLALQADDGQPPAHVPASCCLLVTASNSTGVINVTMRLTPLIRTSITFLPCTAVWCWSAACSWSLPLPVVGGRTWISLLANVRRSDFSPGFYTLRGRGGGGGSFK